SYLLKLGVEICSYSDHVRLLSPSPLVGFGTIKVYSGIGADIVMESITRFDCWSASAFSSANQPSVLSWSCLHRPQVGTHLSLLLYDSAGMAGTHHIHRMPLRHLWTAIR